MKNTLRNEIEKKFNLNEIQKLATENVSNNLIFDAPTASGKTEAILLSLKEGSRVTWMLPTISACTFMYRRLCADFVNLNVEVCTSTMSESRVVNEELTTVKIITCDPLMVDHIKEYATNGTHIKTTDDVLVLDEIDNYPSKVRSVLKHYIKNVELEQVILASATLDEELKSIKNDFKIIRFSSVSNRIRYKLDTVVYTDELVETVIRPNYRQKKIGLILNSISEMEYVADTIYNIMKLNCGEDMNIIYHHSGLPTEIKLENERRMFEKDFDLLISNDLISTSVDVDLDILVMSWSDKLNMNIQRMGRLNRRGKKVSYTNLFIYTRGGNMYPPFIDGEVANSLIRELNIVGKNPIKLITSNMIGEWSEMVKLEDIPFDEVLTYVKSAIASEREVLLRDVPSTLRYEVVEVVQNRKKGKKIDAVRKVMTVDKKMNNLPYDYYEPCSEEDGVMDLLYMPWMYDVNHPSGVNSNTWIIVSYDPETGIRTIEPYDGPKYPVTSDEEESESNEELGQVARGREISLYDYTDSSLDIKYMSSEAVDFECTGVKIGQYEGESEYFVNLSVDSIKEIIRALLKFSNDLSDHQKWSPYVHLDIVKRRANIVLDKVLFKYDSCMTRILKSLARHLHNDPTLLEDKTISILFYKDNEGYINFNKEWLGYSRSIKKFVINEIEKKVNNFRREELKLNEVDLTNNHFESIVTTGIKYGDNLYVFNYPDTIHFFKDDIINNNFNIIEDSKNFESYFEYEKYKLNSENRQILWGNDISIIREYAINSLFKAQGILKDILIDINNTTRNRRLDLHSREMDSYNMVHDYFILKGERYNPDMLIYSFMSNLHPNTDGYYLDIDNDNYLGDSSLSQVLSIEYDPVKGDSLRYNLPWLSLLPSMKEFILKNCIKDVEEKYIYVQFDKFNFDYEVVGRDDRGREIHKPTKVKYMVLEWEVFGDVIFDYTGDVNYSTKRKEIVDEYVYSDGFYSSMCNANYTKHKTKEVLLKQGIKLLIDEDGNHNPLFETIDRLKEIHKEESKDWGRGRGYVFCEYASAEHYKTHEGKILRRLYEETGNTVLDVLETLAYLRANNEIKPIKGYYAWFHCLDKLFYESDVCNNIIFNVEYLSYPYSVVTFVEDVLTPKVKENYGEDHYIKWHKLRDLTGMENGKPDMMIGLFYEVDPAESWLKFLFNK